ncbi:MAG: C40 family peptidase [Prevotellaceae bacterium]|jgi:lipoprotein Spr/probable lipoprotein NlpC|nr:C40 family peptidase [Prevotellaceae bacterium]
MKMIRVYKGILGVIIFVFYTTVVLAQLPVIIPFMPKPVTVEPQSSATKQPATQAKLKPKQKATRYFVPLSDSLSVAARYAQFMQVSDTCILLPHLYAAIDDWIGTPYRYGWNTKKNGTDCSGFVGKVFKELVNIDLPRSATGMAGAIEPKSKNELQEGDLIIFNYYGCRNSHVGIYLQNGWFVHASNVYGVTLANLNTAFYQQKFSKGGPVKNLYMQQPASLMDDNKKHRLEHIEKLPMFTPSVWIPTNTKLRSNCHA